MATRCYIVKTMTDGTFIGIYSHYDGYPGYTLPMLEHYQHPAQLLALFAGGDVKQLMTTVGKTVYFSEGPHANLTKQTVQYAEPAQCFTDLKDVKQAAREANCEYLYIWDHPRNNPHVKSGCCKPDDVSPWTFVSLDGGVAEICQAAQYDSYGTRIRGPRPEGVNSDK